MGEVWKWSYGSYTHQVSQEGSLGLPGDEPKEMIWCQGMWQLEYRLNLNNLP